MQMFLNRENDKIYLLLKIHYFQSIFIWFINVGHIYQFVFNISEVKDTIGFQQLSRSTAVHCCKLVFKLIIT